MKERSYRKSSFGIEQRFEIDRSMKEISLILEEPIDLKRDRKKILDLLKKENPKKRGYSFYAEEVSLQEDDKRHFYRIYAMRKAKAPQILKTPEF